MISSWLVRKVIIVFLDEDEEKVVVTRDMIFTVIVYDVASCHQHALRHSCLRQSHDIYYDIVVYDVAMTSLWVVRKANIVSMKKRWSSRYDIHCDCL